MSHSIHRANVRKKLDPRREPYWAAPLAPGRYIGFQKIDAERGTWIARARAEKGEKTVADAEWRFKHTVYGTEFGSTALPRLRTSTIKRWREGLKLTKSGANRMVASLRATLNLAVEDRQVPATAAQEWRGVKQYKGADGRRELYLDLAQRRALLAGATGGVRDLIEAVLVTGARPGELVAAPRGAFDARTKTLTLRGKTGARTVPLSPAAVALFECLSKSKLPSAPLLARDDGKPWQRAEWTEDVRVAAEVTGVKGKEAKLPPGKRNASILTIHAISYCRGPAPQT